MKLVITIDTEEDNWGDYNLNNYSLENIKRIPALQELFDRFRVKPTYLVTYSVANDKSAVSLLKKILDEGKCEIGTHCHPWNTPPFEEHRNDRNSMLCNLSAELQMKKIYNLHQIITDKFGRAPTSFRAGRWGFNTGTARILSQIGYTVDSSMFAYQNWGDSDGPNYSNVSPRTFFFENLFEPRESNCGQLLEVPSSVGYGQSQFGICNHIWQFLNRPSIQKTHLIGIFRKFHMLNKIWLSPELSSGPEMIWLAKTMMHLGYQITNMFFHSTALKAGLSPFVKTETDERQFLQRIEDFLAFIQRRGVESIRLSEIPSLVTTGNL